MITKEEVAHIAQLSRLALTEEELSRMQQELGEIFTYMKTLSKFVPEECASVEEVPSASYREDVVLPSMARERLLDGAPVHDARYIIVPKTVE